MYFKELISVLEFIGINVFLTFPIVLVRVGSLVMVPLIPYTGDPSSSLTNLAGDLSILLIFPKGQTFGLLFLFLFFVSLIATLTFIIPFLLPASNLICSFF